MSAVQYVGIALAGADLVVLDANRRAYAGLSRDGAYWHLIQPAQFDLVNADGAVIRSEGQLVCGCKGGAFRGSCYRVEQAEAFEAGAGQAPVWIDGGWGAGEAVEASRG